MLKPRESITSLAPYRSPLDERLAINLDLNENTAGCSPRVLARLRSMSMQEISRYPDRERGERAVARFLGVDPAQVMLTNGIDDALLLLFSAYLSNGDEMILADPTFVMYAIYGQAIGAHLVRVQSREDLKFPTAEVLAQISPRTRMIAVANPNNPTGLTVPRAELVRIVESARDAAVLVDEAYFEFGGETLLPDLPRYPNLFVARTFSKAYGLAGLRLGVLVGAANQVAQLRKFFSPFNVNGIALACLDEALADQQFVRDYISQVKTGREALATLCSELGLHSWPSATNFVLVRIGTACAQFVSAMKSRGVMVRNMSSAPGCDGCVRITVPVGQELLELKRAIRETISERS
jgi:histidinol-phosphate aminotransferase